MNRRFCRIACTFAPAEDILQQARLNQTSLGAYDSGLATSTGTPADTPAPGPSPTPTDTPIPTATNTPMSTPTDTPMPTATNTPTPTNTTSASDLIFADGFESGGLSAWSLAKGGIDLRVTNAAALLGANGLQALINDSTALYVRDDSPNAEPRYRARFYFDPNSVLMLAGGYQYILQGYANATNTIVLRVEFKYNSGFYQVRAKILNDSAIWLKHALHDTGRCRACPGSGLGCRNGARSE